MTRHVRTRTVLVVAVALSTSVIGATPALASAPAAVTAAATATTQNPAPIEIAPHWRDTPNAVRLGLVGANGYVHTDEETGYRWTDFATGKSFNPIDGAAKPGEFGTGKEYLHFNRNDGSYIQNVFAGTEQRIALPPLHSARTLLGDRLVVQRYGSDSPRDIAEWLLWDARDLSAPGVPVSGWPTGTNLATVRPVAGDDRDVVFRFEVGGDTNRATHIGVVDRTTGRIQVIEAPEFGSTVLLTPRQIAWQGALGDVHVRDRDRLGEPGSTVRLPNIAAAPVGLVDGWALQLTEVPDTRHWKLTAYSLDGRRTLTLLERASGEIQQIAPGGVAVVGGTSATDWHLQRVTAPADGGVPTLEKLHRVAPVAVEIQALTLGGGTLGTAELGGPRGQGFYQRTVGSAGAPVWLGNEGAQSSQPCWEVSCARLLSNGEGRVLHERIGSEIVSRGPDGQVRRAKAGVRSSTLTDAVGRYALVQSGLYPHPGTIDPAEKTIVLDMEAATGASPVVLQRPQTAAALGPDLLYTGTATGQVDRTDLRTGRSLGPIGTGAPCGLTEIQVANEWLYWACSGFRQQGVVNLRTGAKIALPGHPSSRILLGDGFLVDGGSGTLQLTTFHTGTPVTREVDPGRQVKGERRKGWSVDRFGGAVAYLDEKNTVRVLPSGVPVSPLATVTADAPATMDIARGWKPTWWLTRPAASWKLTVVNKTTGATVRTLSGGAVRGSLATAWDGKDTQGRPVVNGTYAWTLSAAPADGQGRALTRTGEIQLSGTAAPRRDHAGAKGPDGVADLLSLSAKGALSFAHGTGKGAYSGATASTGWPLATLAVPMGDGNGDRCNDLLIRVGDELRSYQPGCGTAPAPKTYTAIGKGWAAFTNLTSPGDLTGDGRPDLVAWSARTGEVFLYPDDGKGKLKPRVTLGTKKTSYRAFFGAGDLNGDGYGDVLAVDSAYGLWRYDGVKSVAGKLKTRVAVFPAKWGTGRNAFVGGGDLNGDGHTDLVSRNAAGELLANHGDGKGSFLGTKKIGAGWGSHKGLF
ncbi:FG-GAP-like repeat-containing protein [Streptomyces sp. NPDC057638]|uniref:FG-GAP-like repeat-containing protein n=1 Tax=Streptomyces sp. NPDC057638 TaxID=3346190 RepID=UPI0036B0EDA3